MSWSVSQMENECRALAGPPTFPMVTPPTRPLSPGFGRDVTLQPGTWGGYPGGSLTLGA